MSRIVAGKAGSTRLAIPRSGTRPTSERVREALFSALEARDAVRDARVLDLYAGSGALGLEAVSRGARSATLVERARPAAACCERNAAAVGRALGAGGAARIEVGNTSVAAYLADARGPVDLVFLDPPYDRSDADLVRELGALVPLLAEDALVILERSTRSAAPEWPDGLEEVRSGRYGDTRLWWARAQAPSQSR